MRVSSFLEKVGAVKACDRKDLLMAIVFVANDFGPLRNGVDQGILLGLVEVKFRDYSEKVTAYDALIFATSGDVRALYPLVCNQKETFLKKIIESLLEIRVFLYALMNKLSFDNKRDADFVESYNDMVGARGDQRFVNKNEILRDYFSGSFTNAGEHIVSEVIGTPDRVVKDIAETQVKFSKHLLSYGDFFTDKIEFVSERSNPLEGGYVAKVTVREKGLNISHECTLHWAPWPMVKTSDDNLRMYDICSEFNETEASCWINRVFGRG